MMEKMGNEYYDVCGDRNMFPTKKDIQNLWRKDFQDKYGERSGTGMFITLSERVEELRLQGHKIKVSTCDEAYVVSLCTPTMQRALTLKCATEILFVDATANCDVQNHRIYFISTYYGAVGGLPLACLVTNSLKADMFDKGMETLLDDFKLFTQQPKIIITDDDLNERRILGKYFPEAKLLLCIFHVLKACWKWLLKKPEIKKEDQQKLYLSFKELVYVKEIKDFTRKYEDIKVLFQHYPTFLKYIENNIIRKEQWALCFRNDLLTRGND
ncbi:hypothetical protein X975_06050, partial [Stegodyphus mimosarum]